MDMKKDVTSVLQQYAMETGVYSTQKVESDFVEVTQQVPAADVTNGLSEAMRSEQTPPFDQMLGQSFEQGDAQQRANMLNQLLDGAGPSVVKPLMESGVLREAFTLNDRQEASVTPELADQVHPEVIQAIAQQAEQDNPEVIDRMSNLYAEDPGLVKTLGGGTLSVALSKMAENR
jgi:hypothetical protein